METYTLLIVLRIIYGELKFAAAVDCTGHGIPGALMSIMANDAYHETLHSDKLTDPGQILTCLNEK